MDLYSPLEYSSFRRSRGRANLPSGLDELRPVDTTTRPIVAFSPPRGSAFPQHANGARGRRLSEATDCNRRRRRPWPARSCRTASPAAAALASSTASRTLGCRPARRRDDHRLRHPRRLVNPARVHLELLRDDGGRRSFKPTTRRAWLRSDPPSDPRVFPCVEETAARRRAPNALCGDAGCAPRRAAPLRRRRGLSIGVIVAIIAPG